MVDNYSKFEESSQNSNFETQNVLCSLIYQNYTTFCTFIHSLLNISKNTFFLSLFRYDRIDWVNRKLICNY